MGDRVSYQCTDSVARIAMDDGKVNVLSSAMQAELHEALDRAVKDEAVVILTGRSGLFSGGFDLGVLRAGGEDALSMLKGGFELAERILSFPYPVVIACGGHAVAMALFIVLSGDYRIGVSGEARLTANEVAIGLTLPRAAIEICRQRLTPAAFTRVVMLAEPFSGQQAVDGGLLDAVVDASELDTRAHEVATALRGLDMAAHRSTKLRARGPFLDALRTAIEQDDADLRPSA
jgi:enoyl-CoA hydratase